MSGHQRIDLHRILPEHEEVHQRLTNWARWVKPGHGRHVTPIGRLYRSNWRQWHVPELNPTVDELDAQRVEKIVVGLPRYHKGAVVWWYVKRTPTHRIRRELGATEDSLLKLCDDGRAMVKNQLRGT